MVLAIGSACTATQSTKPEVLLAFGVALVALAVVLAVRAKPSSAWIVRVHTAGVQQDAVVTDDRARRDAILAALHRAYAG